MKRIDKSKKHTILYSQYIGNDVDDETGAVTELYVNASHSPVIGLPDGTTVIINWEDLIKIAEDYVKQLETGEPQ